MPETIEAAPIIGSRRIVEQCLEFARPRGVPAAHIDHSGFVDRRATPRILFVHQVHYCPSSTFSEDQAKPVSMLDISLGGVGLRCREALTEGAVIHMRLPSIDGTTGWVKGTVAYCRPDTEDYRVGIAFILD